jgi:hypothetical protein
MIQRTVILASRIFIIIDVNWKIHFLETSNWFMEKVIISPSLDKRRKMAGADCLQLISFKGSIKKQSEYDSSQPLNDSYEHLLNEYYENKNYGNFTEQYSKNKYE